MDKNSLIAFVTKNDPCSRMMGVRLIDVENGYARAELPLTDASRNVMGAMHGGALATLADVVAACAVVYHGRAIVTLSSDIHYHKGISEGKATGVAREVHRGHRVAVCTVEIFDDAQALAATATYTMYLANMPVPDMDGTV